MRGRRLSSIVKNLCRCFGAPARRVFPDHLIVKRTIEIREYKRRVFFSLISGGSHTRRTHAVTSLHTNDTPTCHKHTTLYTRARAHTLYKYIERTQSTQVADKLTSKSHTPHTYTEHTAHTHTRLHTYRRGRARPRATHTDHYSTLSTHIAVC